MSTYYRIYKDDVNNTIEVQCISKDTLPTRSYKTFEELPLTLQNRIATLDIMDVEENKHIEGVGYKLNDSKFWIEDSGGL